MPKPESKPRFEGWGVRWRAAGVIAMAAIALAAFSIVGAQLIYTRGGAPAVEAAHIQAFPAPQLNARIDRDADFSFAPRIPRADPQVDQAMRALAAQGDRAWATGGSGQ